MTPTLISSISAMRKAARAAKTGGSLGLVPTMGALHDGHLSLIRAAHAQCNTVVVSIFVNPTQFGPNEDFARYPRMLESDLELLAHEHVDFVFAPSVEEMYPASSVGTFIDVPGISERLDGASRPGHFRAVATVVAKLFNITSPDVAFFGQKDAAQVAVLRAMVEELNFPVQLVVCPTAREHDGLAMSSRNRYLSAGERAAALVLHQALSHAEARVKSGVRCTRELSSTVRNELQAEPGIQIEYIDAVDAHTLLPAEEISQGTLLAVAARIGQTRLIDNIVLSPAMEYACE